MNYPPTVFIVDDDPAVRDSLRWLLESMHLKVATFASAEEFLKFYTMHMIGCLVLDVRMPGMSGLQLQQYLTKQKYCLPIIFITGHGDIPMAVRAMQAGAMYFLEKPFEDQVLLDYVHEALNLDKEHQQSRIRLTMTQARIANLTDREREVMELVIDNHSNKEIAAKLNVSIKTVEFHRSHMMEKMHASSLIELVNMTRETADND
ncbi:MAG TPA: response regulator [Candidatus Thiothrix moscowensis]|uniref:response regulator transcription factor n=1 Tax=unclassified Thiothrix TaxID=2636184 RepID=UPI001A24425C|nr:MULTISPECIES: response regulator [unclassified Thiothrix]MBJ6611221.1 response regulator transcription factor [Candidatus Thiothrix moscowensis]HRJ54213.1 response regulator [Candidatus Thiothrix moscowensis]HRJ94479.1 response regulator [Candidatus Thiothrix moscowensis]